MICAGKAHNFLSSRLVACQTHRLHDRLGPRHVKRDLVFSRDIAQTLYVFQHAGVIGTQDRSQLPHKMATLVDASLIEIQPEQIDAIRPGHVNQTNTVHIGQPNSITATPETAQLNVLLQDFAKLKRHAIVANKLQIRNHRLTCLGVGKRERAAQTQRASKRLKSNTASLHDLCVRSINAKPTLLCVRVTRQPPRKTLRPAQMPSERRVFGYREL